MHTDCIIPKKYFKTDNTKSYGRIKAPDPWKGHTSCTSAGVHTHRSPDDGEGVSPYNNNIIMAEMSAGYLIRGEAQMAYN